MAPSKSSVIVAGLAAAASSSQAAAFQAPATSVQTPSVESEVSTRSVQLQQQASNVASEAVSGRMAASGIATLAAAAVLMANTRKAGSNLKMSSKVTVKAFESERGVQDPVGFFDPLGFTADGSVENFKRRRQTEIKHGRISMLATMGYITPE
eukprot:CAMPEP_0178419334 /NCGR_PEP_ID=MMETSP0689_2-20121128/25555_1 /TAXON_ID=160604 /ORGANISM="Amphidinium massartii, Strain CS-259" /LENGTH=152 /DNA_ID=CAMNT_0020040765 /DNA_START=32 /DNA_END=487 /DNA_ORIENTATION=+